MDIGILGPLEVRREGTTIEIGTRKARVLFAALVLGRNQVVSTDVLIEAAWPQDLPDGARRVAVPVRRGEGQLRLNRPGGA